MFSNKIESPKIESPKTSRRVRFTEEDELAADAECLGDLTIRDPMEVNPEALAENLTDEKFASSTVAQVGDLGTIDPDEKGDSAPLVIVKARDVDFAKYDYFYEKGYLYQLFFEQDYHLFKDKVFARLEPGEVMTARKLEKFRAHVKKSAKK